MRLNMIMFMIMKKQTMKMNNFKEEMIMLTTKTNKVTADMVVEELHKMHVTNPFMNIKFDLIGYDGSKRYHTHLGYYPVNATDQKRLSIAISDIIPEMNGIWIPDSDTSPKRYYSYGYGIRMKISDQNDMFCIATYSPDDPSHFMRTEMSTKMTEAVINHTFHGEVTTSLVAYLATVIHELINRPIINSMKSQDELFADLFKNRIKCNGDCANCRHEHEHYEEQHEVAQNAFATINKDDYEIKQDGKFHQFEGGATRYTKTGKGRFDLICSSVVPAILNRLYDLVDKEHAWVINRGMCTHEAYQCVNWNNKESYDNLIEHLLDEIIELMILKYEQDDVDCYDDDDMHDFVESRQDDIIALNQLLQHLAIHYEKGAEKYGEHNCEKGIPLSSFIDSGRRHLSQYIRGLTDENHFISAVWNFWMAIWTVQQEQDKELHRIIENTDSHSCDDNKDEEDDKKPNYSEMFDELFNLLFLSHDDNNKDEDNEDDD